MKKLFSLPFNAGQTLIEVVIAAGLVVLVLTTLASGVAIGVRNNRIAKDQGSSKEYVREVLEWTRNMRDQTGWNTFATISKNGTYCLSNLPTSPNAYAAAGLGACASSNVIPGTNFTRQLTLTKSGAPTDTIQAVATVSWTDGTKTFSSTSTLTLHDWK